MKQVLLIGVAVLLFSSCAQKKANNHTYITATEAIKLAAESELSKVDGVFILTILSTGNQRQMVYLNSKLDYLDPLNLSIEIPAPIINQLIEKYGSHPKAFFKEKKIQIEGQAKRTKVYKIINGMRTSKYHYKTHIRVSSSTQIEVL